jgi:hypothetical protein
MQPHLQVPFHRERRKDPPVVRHPGDPAAGDPVGRQAGDVRAVERDTASARRDQAQDALDGGGLALAVPAQEADRLAGPDGERQAVQRLGIPIESMLSTTSRGRSVDITSAGRVRGFLDSIADLGVFPIAAGVLGVTAPRWSTLI